MPPTSKLDLGRRGGVFSLDLIHPNSQGYKLVANEYTDAINALIKEDKFFGITSTLEGARYKIP
jgi:lysophospholipase L1-like esterase